MIRLNVVARGMPQYRAKLNKLGIELEKMDVPMRQAGEIGLAAVKSYPPYNDGWKSGHSSFSLYRPGSRYRRTGNLGEGWVGRLTKGSKIVVRYSITNRTVSYMKYVQGPQQTGTHSPWWVRVDQWDGPVGKETTKIFQKFMKDATKGL
jgi:hypothetical protein